MGAGKSTVARWLVELGAFTIDADALVHRLYAEDTALQEALRRRFGESVVEGGAVHRPALSRAVFGRPEALAALEALVHPAVQALRDTLMAEAGRAGRNVCVVEAIKLVESGGSARCDELWIVAAAEPVQFARLAARGVPQAEARRRMSAQGSVASWTAAFHAESRAQGRARPIVILDNSGPEAQGRAQARRFWSGLSGPSSEPSLPTSGPPVP
jgi:dephospho-CoA kinase